MYVCIQYNIICMYVGTSLELYKPTKDTINPAYYTDHYYKHSIGEHYEGVNISPQIKMTPNPAYAVP